MVFNNTFLPEPQTTLTKPLEFEPEQLLPADFVTSAVRELDYA